MYREEMSSLPRTVRSILTNSDALYFKIFKYIIFKERVAIKLFSFRLLSVYSKGSFKRLKETVQ